MNKPKVLLVMHEVPVNSPFLAAKFKALSAHLNLHLLVWSSKNEIEKFVSKYALSAGTTSRIHYGARNVSDVFSLLWRSLSSILNNQSLRKFLLSGSGSIKSRFRLFQQYLPIFYINPDIIHFEFGTLARDIAILKNITNKKVVVSFRGYDLNYVGLHVDDYYKEVWEHADAFHFLGNDLRQRAFKRGYNGGKVEVLIPPAIDADFFSAQRIPKQNDKLIIISVGRLVWKKGYEYGIRAVLMLKQKNIPFEYRIIGDGPHLQALQFTIAELGLNDEVKLLGHVTQEGIKKELNEGSVFLHPAISEGFCNAVLEAQSMALPVICTDADGLNENILNDESGFVVPKWDVNAMSDRLVWCWENKDKLKVMGENGSERVKNNFTLTQQVKSFLDFYADLHAS